MEASSGPGKDAQVLIYHISVPVRIKPNMPVATGGGGHAFFIRWHMYFNEPG